MGIKKNLLLSMATAAIAMSTLVPSAMGATDGVLKDTNFANIANGAKLHAVGWARFQSGGSGIICHVTGTAEAIGLGGTTGNVTAFVITTSSCHGFGVAYQSCTVTADSVNNLPYPVTVTPNDFDVTDNIEITATLGATPFKTCNFSFTDLFFEEITLVPLATGTRTVTNTSNTLGNVVGNGMPIAGFRIEGEGEAENDFLIRFPVAAEGELELTSPERCTYTIHVG